MQVLCPTVVYNLTNYLSKFENFDFSMHKIFLLLFWYGGSIVVNDLFL
jgi:hypothetical protein